MPRASAAERNTSLSLIGGSFTFAALAMFSSSNFIDKVNPSALYWGGVWSLSSIFFMMISIIMGGFGMSRDILQGWKNQFSLQAAFGSLGVMLLVIASAVFLLSPGPNKIAEKRIEVICKN